MTINQIRTTLLAIFLVWGCTLIAAVKPSPALPAGSGFYLSTDLVINLLMGVFTLTVSAIMIPAWRKLSRVEISCERLAQKDMADEKMLLVVIKNAIHEEIMPLRTENAQLRNEMSLISQRVNSLESRISETRK